MKINERSADSKAMLDYWLTVADFVEGQQAVVKGADRYLPKFPEEAAAEYAFRLQVAKFTNIFGDTLDTLAAKPFEEEVQLIGDNIPEQFVEFCENVDGDGMDLTVFAQELFYNAIRDAITWVMIDYPNTDPTVRTLADAKAAKLRPYWTNVQAINVLHVSTKRLNGSRVIDEIRILEDVDGKDAVRVVKLDGGGVVWELHVEDKNGEFVIEQSGKMSIDVIPLVPVMVGKRDGKRFVFTPPLGSALELQRILYRQESDLEHAKVMTAFPMLTASGVSAPTGKAVVKTGPNRVLYAPPSGNGTAGSWSYIEPSASSLQFLAADVEKTKTDLRELGKQPLTATAGLTVVTTMYAAGKAKTAVGAWGLMLKNALENAFVITAKFMNITTEQYDPSVKVFDDYDNFDGEDFVNITTMRTNRDLSRETVWIEAKRRGILSAEFDAEKEAKALLDETPVDSFTDIDEDDETDDNDKTDNPETKEIPDAFQ